MNDAAIILKQVVVCAGERTILDDINLTVGYGERIAVVGHNGAGKSTLLKVMTGIAHPAHGEVHVLGHALRQAPSARHLRRIRSEVGQVFQGLHLVQRLTTLENVLLGGLAHNRSWLSWARLFPRSEVARAQAALQAVGLIGKAHLRADRLSGGERQKTAIARMLMQSPRLILADEPTAALDPLASADIANMLSTLAQQHHMTLVTVVHDPGLLPVLAERVIGLRHGRIVFDLPVASVDDNCLNQLYRDKCDTQNWIARLQRPPFPIGTQA
jgi:phosphonate transport system ATP-binding protein